jgi:hypothetical protein
LRLIGLLLCVVPAEPRTFVAGKKSHSRSRALQGAPGARPPGAARPSSLPRKGNDHPSHLLRRAAAARSTRPRVIFDTYRASSPLAHSVKMPLRAPRDGRSVPAACRRSPWRHRALAASVYKSRHRPTCDWRRGTAADQVRSWGNSVGLMHRPQAADFTTVSHHFVDQAVAVLDSAPTIRSRRKSGVRRLRAGPTPKADRRSARLFEEWTARAIHRQAGQRGRW